MLKIRFSHISIAIAMAIVVSCSRNGDSPGIETVELQDLVPQDVNISSFTTEVETVGLESREDCLVGMIRDMEIGNSRIYISDLVTRSILVFDRFDGTFLSRLHKQGRGPGEYLEITDFCVDDAAGTIEIFDGSAGHLLTYDSNSFEFLESEDVPLLASGGFLKKDGIYYFDTHRMSNHIGEERTNSGIVSYNPDTKEFKALFDDIRPEGENRLFSINGFWRSPGNRLYYSQNWNDMVYEIKDNRAVPVLRVDPGRKGVPESIRKGSYEQQEKFIDSGSEGYRGFCLAYMNDGDMIIPFLDGGVPQKLMFYLKFDATETIAENIIMDNIPESPLLENAMIMDGNMVTYSFPESPDANPSIMIFKIK